MYINILCIIVVIAAIVMVLLDLKSDSAKKSLRNIQLGMMIIVVSGIAIFIIFATAGKERITSETLTACHQQSLAQVTMPGEKEYYLVLKDQTETIQFAYFDEEEGLCFIEVPAEENTIHYHGLETPGFAFVSIREIEVVHHHEWFFMRSKERETIKYEYDFYIPDTENIYHIQ